MYIYREETDNNKVKTKNFNLQVLTNRNPGWWDLNQRPTVTDQQHSASPIILPNIFVRLKVGIGGIM